MSARRVAVTGLGAVTPLGASVSSTLSALAAGAVAARPPTAFDAAAFAEVHGGEVGDLDARAYFRVPKAAKLADRSARFAVAAARMALADGGWPVDDGPHDRLGVVIGSSGSDLQAQDLARALGREPDAMAGDIPRFAERILSGLNPLWLLLSLPNMVSAQVAIQLDARGPNSTVMTDWVAGPQAIGEAFDWIRAGETDAVLAGGADSGIQPFAYASYEQAGLLGADGPRRFIPAEGAAVLLLEAWDRAVARGARPLAEVRAYAARVAHPDNRAAGSALAAAMRDVLAEAGWRQGEVCTLTAASVFAGPYARAERRAMCEVFDCKRAPKLIEFTSRLGHALGAAGAIDAALTLAAAARTAPGPPVSGAAQARRILCTSIGYSGQAVALGFEA